MIVPTTGEKMKTILLFVILFFRLNLIAQGNDTIEIQRIFDVNNGGDLFTECPICIAKKIPAHFEDISSINITPLFDTTLRQKLRLNNILSLYQDTVISNKYKSNKSLFYDLQEDAQHFSLSFYMPGYYSIEIIRTDTIKDTTIVFVNKLPQHSLKFFFKDGTSARESDTITREKIRNLVEIKIELPINVGAYMGYVYVYDILGVNHGTTESPYYEKFYKRTDYCESYQELYKPIISSYALFSVSSNNKRFNTLINTDQRFSLEDAVKFLIQHYKKLGNCVALDTYSYQVFLKPVNRRFAETKHSYILHLKN